MEQFQLSDVSKALTLEDIQRVFRIKTNSEDRVKRVQVLRASPAGEGLIGAVYRILASGTSHQVSFVIKGMAGDKLLRRTLNCNVYFRRETQFFTEVLPLLVETQKKLGGRERLQNNIPICYGCHCDGETDYIIMEDLAESRCRAVSEDLTLTERDGSLKVLAHLHAVSIALRATNPELFDKITKTLPEVYYTEPKKTWYTPYLQNGVDIAKKALAGYEDRATSIYYKKFDQVTSRDVYGQLIELANTYSDNRAILQGDAWCPNFMCSKDRIVLIDFQLLRAASVALEVTYFIMVAGDLCKTKEDFDKAVISYYNSLEYYLADMGLSAQVVFPLGTLKEEIKKFGRFGLLAALTSIPLRATTERCDLMQSAGDKYVGVERIPLQDLWKLRPLQKEEHKMLIVNIVRVAVDSGLI